MKNIFCATTLVERLYKFTFRMSVSPSDHLSVCSQHKFSEMGRGFFLIFYITQESHKVRKVSEISFWKMVLTCQEGAKSLKVTKNKVLGVLKKALSNHMWIFLLEYERTSRQMFEVLTFFFLPSGYPINSNFQWQ